MATLKVPLTGDTAVDVKTDQSLSDGTAYSIQAIGGEVCVSELGVAPTIGTAPFHVLEEDQEPWKYTAKSGESLYAWGRFGRCSLSITEAE